MKLSFNSGMFKRRGWVFDLLLLALFARALIPVGFMPGSLRDGSALVVCSADGSGVSLSNNGSGDHPGVHHVLNCPFAQSAGGAPLPSLSPGGVLPALNVELSTSRAHRLAPLALPWRYSAPRGPPLAA